MLGKIKKNIYLLIIIIVLFISGSGATYAYWVATAKGNQKLQASSSSYSISLDVAPIYNGYPLVPMNDSDILTAVDNNYQCRDKNGYGACYLYDMRVYNYGDSVSYISGYMEAELNNITNLSYTVFEESNEKKENCIEVRNKNFCISQDISSIVQGEQLTLGNEYNVKNTTSKELLLAIWIKEIGESQNEADIGSFNAAVTFELGNGGQIKGNIMSALVKDNTTKQSEE